MINSNAQVTGWQKAGNPDRYGQPTREAQDGGPWDVIAEPISKTLKRGDRKITATYKVHFIASGGKNIPAVALGDILVMDSLEYEIVQLMPVHHNTLGHTTVLLS